MIEYSLNTGVETDISRFKKTPCRPFAQALGFAVVCFFMTLFDCGISGPERSNNFILAELFQVSYGKGSVDTY